MPLKAYVHTPGLVEDYDRACYSKHFFNTAGAQTQTTSSDKYYVKFGSPEGCGKGCQHISTVSATFYTRLA